jgi:hypothetical protein
MGVTNEIVIILDRSGSMSSIREAMLTNINQLIAKVSQEPGEGYWTFVQFDDYNSAEGAKEDFPQIVYEHKHDKQVEPITDFAPRGGTALIDAVCITINKVKSRIETLPIEQRPYVMVIIITDGEENSSKVHSTDDMRKLIADVGANHKFSFMYLGANQDGFTDTGGRYVHTATSNFGMAGTITSGYLMSSGFAPDASNSLPFEMSDGSVSQMIASGALGVAAFRAMANTQSSMSGYIPPVT